MIDGKLLWHGGMNLLGKADVYDNLIRNRKYAGGSGTLRDVRKTVLRLNNKE